MWWRETEGKLVFLKGQKPPPSLLLPGAACVNKAGQPATGNGACLIGDWPLGVTALAIIAVIVIIIVNYNGLSLMSHSYSRLSIYWRLLGTY